MSEFIKVIVSIKDPFTLLAVFAVVLLLAFRTKTVPESLFRLLGQKIGRDRFYQLLNRTLHYSFAVFLVSCGIAVLGQWLTYKTTARGASLEELKTELAHHDATDAAVKRALAEYEKGLQLSQNDKVSEAIASLEASLKAVPTATARETLALLYQEAGNRDGAIRLAKEAVSEALGSGDAVKVVKAERLLASVTTPGPTVAPRDPVQTFITDRMQPASAAFYAPSQMQRDQPSEVLLEIAPPTISPADLAMELSIVADEKLKSTGVSAPRSTTQGVTASGLIRAAPRMVANLSADRACTITPKDPLDRAVASHERVRWRWTVTPKVAGPINLTATLSAPVILEGKETSYSIRSFDETVTVIVTNQQRATDALEWAKNHWVMLIFAGGALLGLLRWLWRHMRKPTPPAPPKQLPE
jgi:tetratricopeptide (TPR) repeat protein